MKSRFLSLVLGGAVLIGAVACDDDDDDNDLLLPPGTVTFSAEMNGANERPTPVNTTATGTSTFILIGNTLLYNITATGLSSPVNGAHIHVGNSTQAGPIIFPFTFATIQTGTVASGSIDLTGQITPGGITGDSLRVLLNNGNAYTNVHTVNNPNGEIRGQIRRQNTDD